MRKRLIRFGETIRLKHAATGRFLASLPRNYTHAGSSQQQMVVGREPKDSDSLWMIQGPDGQPPEFRNGTPLEDGDHFRLLHTNTGRNLHSHDDRPSPITGHQEVTGFGTRGIGDDNDNWELMIDGGGRWQQDKPFRLRHVRSRQLLQSQLHDPSALTHFEQEIACQDQQGPNNLWTVPLAEQNLNLLPGLSSVGAKRALDVLNLVGAIASITGWSIVTLLATVSPVSLGVVASDIVSVLVVLGACSVIASNAMSFAGRYFRSPRPSLEKWGLILLTIAFAIIAMFLIFLLIPYLAIHVFLRLSPFK